ncbi:MAG: hypothetical protein DRJ42_29295 [Deltaproteobacteria bacterium]|nr:MAG: hypothetical protein DRJ42_29295 [Deltaproteobacteria bacterium]
MIVADGGSAIVLEDGPLFGVLVDVSELWERVRQGAMTAEAVDFYGEYKLVMRVREGVVELENEFSGARVSVPQQAFAIAAGVWSESLLKEAEQRHPGLSQNSNYAKLKSFVQTTWAATAHT